MEFIKATGHLGRWYVVGLLSLLYALSMVDRFALALLAEPIIIAFQLSASQMGLLLGVGFALLYSATGLPLAHMLDRHTRKYVLVGGVTLWSISTILSAFTQGFMDLLVCRSGVAIGEAVLTPAAISLIADMFDRDERKLPISVYSSVSSLMVTGSFIVGAAALHLATSMSDGIGLEPWRITLILVGVPGLVIAALFAATVREPARRKEEQGIDVVKSATTAELFNYLATNRSFYIPFYLALGSMSVLLFAILSWVPTMLAREQGYSTSDAGYIFGLVGIVTGLVGTFLWPQLATRVDREGSGIGFLRMILACIILGSLGSFIAMAFGILALLFIGLALAMMTFPPVNTALSSLLIQGFGPASMRARLIALNILVMNLFGYTMGPQFIGAYVDAGEGNLISDGITWLAVFAGPIAAYCLFLAHRAFGRMTEPVTI